MSADAELRQRLVRTLAAEGPHGLVWAVNAMVREAYRRGYLDRGTDVGCSSTRGLQAALDDWDAVKALRGIPMVNAVDATLATAIRAHAVDPLCTVRIEYRDGSFSFCDLPMGHTGDHCDRVDLQP